MSKIKEFQEFTFVEPESNIEIMVDIDNDNKIVDIYTYAEDVKDLPFSARWKKGQNPLFAHNKNVGKSVFNLCVVSPENLEQYEFLHKTARINKFSQLLILEP